MSKDSQISFSGSGEIHSPYGKIPPNVITDTHGKIHYIVGFPIDDGVLSFILQQLKALNHQVQMKDTPIKSPMTSPKEKSTTVDQVSSQPVITTMHITSKAQFLQIEEAQAKSIKSITFEGFEIDNEFASHFDLVMYHHVDNLTFQNCTFADGFSFSELFDSEYSVVNLSIVNCGITVYDASEILSRVNQYLIKSVDFSENGFQGQYDLFQKEVIKKEITGRMCLDKLSY